MGILMYIMRVVKIKRILNIVCLSRVRYYIIKLYFKRTREAFMIDAEPIVLKMKNQKLTMTVS